MSRSVCVVILLAILVGGFTFSIANGQDTTASDLKKGIRSMSTESEMIGLFNRWEQVWNEGKFDLVPSCVADSYIRHDPKGDRTVTRDAYAAEVASIHKDRPDIRVIVYDHSFIGDRAWFRFAFKWTDTKSGEAQTQAGMQVYRISHGKLAETWISFLPSGTVWTDAPQANWTSEPSIK